MTAKPLLSLALVLPLLACPALAADRGAIARLAFGGIQPRISPDGKTIALSYQGGLCTMPVSGGTLRRLGKGEPWDVDPAWSPDGKRIAYVSAPGFTSGRLMLVDAASGASIDLPKPVTAWGPLFFHPDGKRILARYRAGGPSTRVGWADLETGETMILEGIGPDDPQVLQRQRIIYALSHDGTRILYALHLDLPDEQGGNMGQAAIVWQIDSGGGTPRKIVEFPSRIYGMCWDANDGGAYLVTDPGTAHYDIWHLPLDDDPLRGAEKITSGQADEDWPSVTPGGRLLVHTENSRGATAIIARNLENGTSTELPSEGIDFGEPAGSLDLKIIDADTGSPVVARISLKREGGKFHGPAGSLYRITGGVGHFYGSHPSLNLPAGNYQVTTVRGLEYRVDTRSIEISAGETKKIEVALERWSHVARNGWYSGENHVHANYGYGHWYNTPETILRQCQGEELNVCNAVVANSNTDGVFDREFFLGRPDDKSTPDAILYWNQEFRSTMWGHMTLSNLSRLVEPIFTGFLHTTNPWDVPTNADVARETRDNLGIVSYTHPAANFLDLYDQPYAAKGLPVDAALGRIDTMDVMGHTYQGSVLFWYKLLNCGFRVAASAGTDCFLNRVNSYPPGWGRAYVHLPGELNYADWVEGQKAGRAFITNGPMLELSVDGLAMGDTLELANPREVKVVAKADSQHPIEKLEIVYNGETVATGKLSGDGKTGVFDESVTLDKSGWIALRAEGPSAPYVVRRNLYAHTNPVYIELKGRVVDAREEAAYFLRWIDRLEADFRKRDRVPTDAARQRVLRQLEAARDVYREIRKRSEPRP